MKGLEEHGSLLDSKVYREDVPERFEGVLDGTRFIYMKSLRDPELGIDPVIKIAGYKVEIYHQNQVRFWSERKKVRKARLEPTPSPAPASSDTVEPPIAALDTDSTTRPLLNANSKSNENDFEVQRRKGGCRSSPQKKTPQKKITKEPPAHKLELLKNRFVNLENIEKVSESPDPLLLESFTPSRMHDIAARTKPTQKNSKPTKELGEHVKSQTQADCVNDDDNNDKYVLTLSGNTEKNDVTTMVTDVLQKAARSVSVNLPSFSRGRLVTPENRKPGKDNIGSEVTNVSPSIVTENFEDQNECQRANSTTAEDPAPPDENAHSATTAEPNPECGMPVDNDSSTTPTRALQIPASPMKDGNPFSYQNPVLSTVENEKKILAEKTTTISSVAPMKTPEKGTFVFTGQREHQKPDGDISFTFENKSIQNSEWTENDSTKTSFETTVTTPRTGIRDRLNKKVKRIKFKHKLTLIEMEAVKIMSPKKNMENPSPCSPTTQKRKNVTNSTRSLIPRKRVDQKSTPPPKHSISMSSR